LTTDSGRDRRSDGVGLPAVWQQFLDPIRPMRWQSRQDILQVGVRGHARSCVRTGSSSSPRLHAGRRAGFLQAANYYAQSNRPDLVFDPVVVHGQLPVVHESGI